jgi:hypothetical protein
MFHRTYYSQVRCRISSELPMKSSYILTRKENKNPLCFCSLLSFVATLLNTNKTKDRVTRTPLKTGVELRCSGRVGSSCSTSDTRRVNLVKCATSRILGTNPYNTGEMSCLSFCTFTFGHCVVCSSSIYGFWLCLWYLQTLLNIPFHWPKA